MNIMDVKYNIKDSNLKKINQIFARNWTKDPLMLDEVSKESLNKIVLKWPPKIDTDTMSIISPKFPEQNTVFNVNRFTFKTIVEELHIGALCLT